MCFFFLKWALWSAKERISGTCWCFYSFYMRLFTLFALETGCCCCPGIVWEMGNITSLVISLCLLSCLPTPLFSAFLPEQHGTAVIAFSLSIPHHLTCSVCSSLVFSALTSSCLHLFLHASILLFCCTCVASLTVSLFFTSVLCLAINHSTPSCLELPLFFFLFNSSLICLHISPRKTVECAYCAYR